MNIVTKHIDAMTVTDADGCDGHPDSSQAIAHKNLYGTPTGTGMYGA